MAGSSVDSAALQQSTNPQVLLAAADHFYWLNNGPASAPLFARAEKLFAAKGDDETNFTPKWDASGHKPKQCRLWIFRAF